MKRLVNFYLHPGQKFDYYAMNYRGEIEAFVYLLFTELSPNFRLGRTFS
jgi:hypothetical protein